MPPFIHIQPVWVRRFLVVLLAPFLLVLLVCIRISKVLMTAFSEFAEIFSAVWKGRQEAPSLLPCPFCGGKCVPDGWRTQGGATGPACDDCGATTWSIDTWNTRVPLTEEKRQETPAAE
ncbi:MAG: hypothetical protein NC112_09435 [Oxalobacter formigenes]|nr:hypothetical protein [Oxalobacter formigenes]